MAEKEISHDRDRWWFPSNRNCTASLLECMIYLAKEPERVFQVQGHRWGKIDPWQTRD